jgi:uncharacterized membrane protein YdjX (TVP38/TMEM64 family)
MIETLASYLDHAGPYAPLGYISLFLLTALVPVIPTPLVSALGGGLLGFGPAVGYGFIGLCLGAFLALNLSRRLGRPVVIRLFGKKAWEDWEVMLGIRSPVTWGVLFFIFNIDFVVVAAGLSGIALWKLWLAAIIARMPWVVATAWFGDMYLVSDRFLIPGLLIGLAAIVIVNLLRARLRPILVQRTLGGDQPASEADTADVKEPSKRKRRERRPSLEPQ